MTATAVDTEFARMQGGKTFSAPVSVVNLVGASAKVAIARPQNVLAYGAGDAVGQADGVTPANAGSAILTFADVGGAGGVVKIVGADLGIDLSAVPAGMGAFTLHLYDAAPTAILDNAAWTLPAADQPKYLGYIPISAPAVLGGALFVQNDGLAKQVKLAEGSKDLFGVLVTVGGYTPTSGEVYRVRLQVEAKS